MPRRRWIDKKSAAHFTLVHRPQNDPRIHDESAPAMVLNPTQAPNAGGTSSSGTSHKSKQLDELASQLGSEVDDIRANEGEAANFGVFYDDTEYDYMQHLRDIGQGGGETVFVESTASLNNNSNKGKQKQSLADALQQMDLQHRSEDLLDEDILPSKALQRVTYQNQQDVPDAIAGFKPDMDPRLREALEALEDEAYVDDDEGNDDLFQELAKDGQELDTYEFEDTYEYDDDDGDDGWESDATEKPAKPRTGFGGDGDNEDEEAAEARDTVPELVDLSRTAAATATATATATAAPPPPPEGADGPSDDWMEDFNKFKKEQKMSSSAVAKKKPAPALSEVQSSVWTTTTSGGRKKKRKGALTQQSGFSMTSSSLVRTEQLSLLDARFDKIDEEYNNDEEDGDFGDDMRSVSAFSSASSVQGPLRNDFDGIMDEFLGGYSMQGKRSIKKGRQQSGLEQLEEIRRGLGPARLSTRKK